MQKVIPCIWLDGQAEEAAQFYTSIFDNSKIRSTNRYPDAGQEIHGQEAGSVLTVLFEVEGFSFMLLNGGSAFAPNPSISFFLNFDPAGNQRAADDLQSVWSQLAEGGRVLMELGEYPFSQTYGWVQDKFGLSWQLMLTNPEGQPRPFVMPSLLFTGKVANQAKKAVDFYVDVFKESEMGNFAPYPEDTAGAKKGSAMFADFKLGDTWLAAMDSGVEHEFGFNEGISLLLNCQSQEEIDYYWQALSAVPEAEQCGWIKDRFGLSWQITPADIDEWMSTADPDKVAQAFGALLQMKKLNLAELKRLLSK